MKMEKYVAKRLFETLSKSKITGEKMKTYVTEKSEWIICNTIESPIGWTILENEYCYIYLCEEDVVNCFYTPESPLVWSYTMDYSNKNIIITTESGRTIMVSEKDVDAMKQWFNQAHAMKMWIDNKNVVD